MENIIVLAEWYGNSCDGVNIMAILLGIALAFVFSCYMVFLLTDKESYTFLLILSVVLAFLLWFPLNDCIQHRNIHFSQNNISNHRGKALLLFYINIIT